MTRLARGLALALAAGLVGCSSLAGVVLPVSDENELGAEMELQLARELKLLEDPVVVDYVRRVGQELAAAARDDVPEGIVLEFHVVDDDATINAFAIPGGTIYVYTGLLRAARDEAELAGVLGHEMAHVTQRHIAQQLTARLGVDVLLGLVGLAGGWVGLVGQLAGNVGAQGFLLAYGRDAEREADHVGLAYAARAGWDPSGLIDFFAMLERQGDRNGLPSFLLTHPEPGERIEDAAERIRELAPVPTRRDRARYQRIVARLGGPLPGQVK